MQAEQTRSDKKYSQAEKQRNKVSEVGSCQWAWELPTAGAVSSQVCLGAMGGALTAVLLEGSTEQYKDIKATYD